MTTWLEPIASLPDGWVAQLRFKYAQILAMRLAHHDATEDAGLVRGRMNALASEFPGALREIDRLELDEVRRRVAALDRVVVGADEVQPWMVAVALFHRWMRGALCAKQWVSAWLVSNERLDADAEQAFAHALRGFSFPLDAAGWASDLERIASPPGGRVTRLVFERIAQALGTTDDEAHILVFGPFPVGRNDARTP